MELRSHKVNRSAFTCQVGRSISLSSICSGESTFSSSDIPPFEFSFKDGPNGISNLARDYDLPSSDQSTSNTPLHTPVNSRRGSHDSLLSTESRDALLNSLFDKHKSNPFDNQQMDYKNSI